ncbi:MAG: hypothetical protein QM504_11925 [Pseudomonadota bacterium]
MNNTSLSEIQYNEFMLSTLSLLRDAREEELTESEIMIRQQQVNEKYLMFLITLVLEDEHHDEGVPQDIIDKIQAGELSYKNVAEYAPVEPLYQINATAMMDALKTH